MTNEEIVNAAKEHERRSGFGELAKSELSRGVNSAYGIGFLDGAEWALSQPQIIEIFGKRVKIVKDTKDIDGCEICTFSSKCHHIDVGSLCEDSSFNTNRHFVGCEIDKTYFDIAVRRIKDELSQPQLF